MHGIVAAWCTCKGISLRQVTLILFLCVCQHALTPTLPRKPKLFLELVVWVETFFTWADTTIVQEPGTPCIITTTLVCCAVVFLLSVSMDCLCTFCSSAPGARMYLNAILIPGQRDSSCEFDVDPYSLFPDTGTSLSQRMINLQTANNNLFQVPATLNNNVAVTNSLIIRKMYVLCLLMLQLCFRCYGWYWHLLWWLLLLLLLRWL
jgi:hypothetical protein